MYKKQIKEIPIYFDYLGIILTDDKKKLKKDIGLKIDYLICHAYDDAYIDEKKDKWHCIYLIFNPYCKRFDELGYGFIAHECFHAVSFLFKRRGIEYNHINDESFAYMIQYFVNEVHKFFKKHKIKICR